MGQRAALNTEEISQFLAVERYDDVLALLRYKGFKVTHYLCPDRFQADDFHTALKLEIFIRDKSQHVFNQPCMIGAGVGTGMQYT